MLIHFVTNSPSTRKSRIGHYLLFTDDRVEGDNPMSSDRLSFMMGKTEWTKFLTKFSLVRLATFSDQE